MATVILGGGIIGTSIAYFLSEQAQAAGKQHQIHIVDPSAELFASASGYAAGFCAKDWFAPELASLGLLSFALQRKLADENNGSEKWGYMESTALGLQVEGKNGEKSGSGHDWLTRGASRAEVAVRKDGDDQDEGDLSPGWLTKQKGGSVERISNRGSAAQVDPLRLCQFLLSKCLERGVKVHYPARAISLNKTASGTDIVLQRLDTGVRSNISCTNLVLAAGVWTHQAFTTLFPNSQTRIPVTSLSGYSLVFRSPRHTLSHERSTYASKSHAIFTTHPKSVGFAPEIFSRAGAEIYIAGLNSPDIPPPALPTDSRGMMEKEKCARVKKAAVILMGKPGEVENEDDLEVVQEGLCFRPWTEAGRPIVGRLERRLMGEGAVPDGGVYVATGHGPWGIALSLGTGKVVAEMLAGVKTSADVSGLGFEGAAVKSKL